MVIRMDADQRGRRGWGGVVNPSGASCAQAPATQAANTELVFEAVSRDVATASTSRIKHEPRPPWRSSWQFLQGLSHVGIVSYSVLLRDTGNGGESRSTPSLHTTPFATTADPHPLHNPHQNDQF